MNVRKLFTEIKKEIIKESDRQGIVTTIRDSLKDVYGTTNNYKGEGNWGKKQDPDNNCITGFGVLGVYQQNEKEKNGWSLINRFDTNTLVHNKLKTWYDQDNSNELNIINWIQENKFKLFGYFDEDGSINVNLSELVDLVRITVSAGDKNEELVFETLEYYFSNKLTLNRYCPGHVEDREKGRDIRILTPNGNEYYLQVKPFNEITYYNHDAYFFYRIDSNSKLREYGERNVNIYAFANSKTNEVYLFKNVPHLITGGYSYLDFEQSTLIYPKNIKLPLLKYNEDKKEIKKFKNREGISSLFDPDEKNRINKRVNQLKIQRDTLTKLIRAELKKLKSIDSEK